jgi:hypothetical protein
LVRSTSKKGEEKNNDTSNCHKDKINNGNNISSSNSFAFRPVYVPLGNRESSSHLKQKDVSPDWAINSRFNDAVLLLRANVLTLSLKAGVVPSELWPSECLLLNLMSLNSYCIKRAIQSTLWFEKSQQYTEICRKHSGNSDIKINGSDDNDRLEESDLKAWVTKHFNVTHVSRQRAYNSSQQSSPSKLSMVTGGISLSDKSRPTNDGNHGDTATDWCWVEESNEES